MGAYRYRACHGGRSSAKSHSFAIAAAVRSAQKPIRVLCCREIQNSIKESVKKVIEDKICECGWGPLNGDGFFRSTDTEITNRIGSWFGFAGLRTNIQSVKSTEGIDLAWVEEASTVSQHSLKVLTPTIRKPGSEIWVTWNPEDPKDPVDKMFRGKDGPPPRSIVREVNYLDNPFFSEVSREEMEWDRSRDPELYAHVWLGQYRQRSEARVFKNWVVREFETPSDAAFYFGGDWGFGQDPTVLVRCFLAGRKLYIDHEAFKIGCEVDDTAALFAGDDERDPPRWQNLHRHAGIPGAAKWPIRADSARPDLISYLNRRGFNIVPATKGTDSVEEGVVFLQSHDIIVHPRCKRVINELTYYSYKVEERTERILPVLEDKNNHFVDSIRYSLEQVRQSKPLQFF